MSEILGFVAGGGSPHPAPGVTGGILELFEDRPLSGLVGAVTHIRIGEQAEVHYIEPLVTRVTERRCHRVSEAEAGDGAGRSRG